MVSDPTLPMATFSAVNFQSDPLVADDGRRFLESLLGELVEFLPCTTPDGARWLGHVTYASECLDLDASDWHGTPEVRSTIFRYAFRSDELAAVRAPLFRLRSYPVGLYCTDDFKAGYEASGLTGLHFDEVMRMPDT